VHVDDVLGRQCHHGLFEPRSRSDGATAPCGEAGDQLGKRPAGAALPRASWRVG